MAAAQERKLVGLDYLQAVTALLQRTRHAHPTKGLFEAADLQWWWGRPRSTDAVDQLFWFDDGRPVAAMIVTDWGDETAIVPIVMPDAPRDWVAHVVERGLAHVTNSGFDVRDLEVDRADEVMQGVLADHGFEVNAADAERSTGSLSVVEAWLAADLRPEVSPLEQGYRLTNRRDTEEGPHHNGRTGPEMEARLQQTSLYRSDLDLVVFDSDNNTAAFGLFWFDPETLTGLVEPMRTEDEHLRRGLARHVLTAGIELLANAGAERIKICFESNNPASSHLYLSVGFEPVKETAVYSRPTVRH